eukprot:TRINITY_DN4688_c0_g2_i10.p1 TRINITY_DN4688_c0_g2~~TRINITY_DN4688_c0_g2_i10.p1  ORF type:complete len:222 (-),score=40.17 TRINITY_DN4688_c0_g2_i10:509-1174(-)
MKEAKRKPGELTPHLPKKSRTAVREIITCPVCLGLSHPPILQCVSGHIVCSACLPSLKICPICGVPYGDVHIRNRALEELITDLVVECPFRAEGCDFQGTVSALSEHEKTCNKRPVECPECNKTFIKPGLLIEHLGSVHSRTIITIGNNTKLINLSITQGKKGWAVVIQHEVGPYFYFTLKPTGKDGNMFGSMIILESSGINAEYGRRYQPSGRNGFIIIL